MAAEEEVPPWVAPKFDVKKKPPPVPKPRPRQVNPVELQQPTRAPSPRQRWGQLEASQSEAEARQTAEGSAASPEEDRNISEAEKLSPEQGNAEKLSVEGYRESWQRWQHMPSFLEERRQKLMEKPIARPPQPPSQEALDFLEALLEGTEPSTASGQRPQDTTAKNDPQRAADDKRAAAPKEVETSAGAAQVLSAAQRLKAQAEEVRRRRYEAPESRQAETRNEAGKPPEPDLGAFEQREQKKRQEHERRLRELEEEAERERQELLKQMEKDQADLSARRQEQQAWQEDLARKTREQKQTAERELRAKQHAQGFESAAWRQKWWQDWYRTEAKRKQKEDAHTRWSEQWREQFRAPEEEEEGPSETEEPHDERTGSPPRRPVPPVLPPSKDADADERQLLLQDLQPKRLQPLEERKRVWRALCLRWHPDKCEDKEKATRVFQHLSSLKDWFLAET